MHIRVVTASPSREDPLENPRRHDFRFPVQAVGLAWLVVLALAAPSHPHDCQVFPPDNPWNTDVSGHPVHPLSDVYIDSIGRDTRLHPDFGTVWNGAPIGIPFVEVPADQPLVPITFYYADESDPGPYPIPPDAPIEGGPDSDGDRHVLVIDADACVLYELYDAWPVDGGESWLAGSGAVWDLGSNALRPEGWTSADAAGLPIYPGLVRYEEVVEEGVIDHALRFTAHPTQRAYLHPARHYASTLTDPSLPPMGLRVRMRASYDCSGYSEEVQVVCTALKKYGMLLADNGSDWYVSGAPDPRWDDDRLADLKRIPGGAFEVVDTPAAGGPVSCVGSGAARLRTKTVTRKGKSLPGVTMTLSGPGCTDSAVTDAKGLAVFPFLAKRGYTVEPSGPACAWKPATRSVTNLKKTAKFRATCP